MSDIDNQVPALQTELSQLIVQSRQRLAASVNAGPFCNARRTAHASV